MGSCQSSIAEIRFVFEQDLTQVYIAVMAYGDCPLGVQGWHHKTFPANHSAIDILQGPELKEYLLWPLGAPKEERSYARN